MSAFSNPFNPGVRLGAGCDCGKHASQAEHDIAVADEPACDDVETLNRRAIESAVMRALFPRDAARRRFLNAVGSSAAMAALLMPVWAADDVNPDEIIRKFAAKELEFQQARNNYTYRQSVKMEELDPSGNPTGGKWEIVEDIIFTPEGKRYPKVVYAPVISLHNIGISPEDQKRIFERFYRADNARVRNVRGSGIGLSLVKHIAEAHGGSVTVDSEPGKGAAFIIDIPLVEPKTEEAA